MSQQKVDKYKEQKANRKQTMKKEKTKKIARRLVAGACAIVLAGWLGYSVYNIYDSNKAVETAEVDYSAVENYANSLAEAAE